MKQLLSCPELPLMGQRPWAGGIRLSCTRCRILAKSGSAPFITAETTSGVVSAQRQGPAAVLVLRQVVVGLRGGGLRVREWDQLRLSTRPEVTALPAPGTLPQPRFGVNLFCIASVPLLSPLVGFDWHFKPLSTLLQGALSRNPSNIKKIPEKFSWECRHLNPGVLGEKQECHLCAIVQPSPFPLPKGVNLSRTSVVLLAGSIKVGKF